MTPEKLTITRVTGVFTSESGGGLGTIFIGLAVVFITFIVFINIADYSLFTYKRNAISKAMDYAVTSGVQQINTAKSLEGVANGFSENTGGNLVEGVEIDIDMATKTFLDVFYSNYKSDDFSIDDNLLVCATSSMNENLKYTIKANNQQREGELDDPILMEDVINNAINQHWPDSEDSSQIYINGNSKTNMIDCGTYLFAFIKNIKIKGLFSEREISLSSFAGAKLERQIQK